MKRNWKKKKNRIKFQHSAEESRDNPSKQRCLITNPQYDVGAEWYLILQQGRK
jgi:hypothetical protein